MLRPQTTAKEGMLMRTCIETTRLQTMPTQRGKRLGTANFASTKNSLVGSFRKNNGYEHLLSFVCQTFLTYCHRKLCERYQAQIKMVTVRTAKRDVRHTTPCRLFLNQTVRGPFEDRQENRKLGIHCLSSSRFRPIL